MGLPKQHTYRTSALFKLMSRALPIIFFTSGIAFGPRPPTGAKCSSRQIKQAWKPLSSIVWVFLRRDMVLGGTAKMDSRFVRCVWLPSSHQVDTRVPQALHAVLLSRISGRGFPHSMQSIVPALLVLMVGSSQLRFFFRPRKRGAASSSCTTQCLHTQIFDLFSGLRFCKGRATKSFCVTSCNTMI